MSCLHGEPQVVQEFGPYLVNVAREDERYNDCIKWRLPRGKKVEVVYGNDFGALNARDEIGKHDQEDGAAAIPTPLASFSNKSNQSNLSPSGSPNTKHRSAFHNADDASAIKVYLPNVMQEDDHFCMFSYYERLAQETGCSFNKHNSFHHARGEGPRHWHEISRPNTGQD